MKTKFLILLLFLMIVPPLNLILNIGFNRHFQENNLFSMKLSKAEIAYYRAEYEFMKIRDPNTNSVPENARLRELEFAKSLPTRESNPKSDIIQSMNWVSRGPVNISGRMLAIEFDKNNENIIIAGSASGGVWKSVDKGNSWVRASSANDIQGVTCISQDTRFGKNKTWYYGTGELLSTTDRRISTSVRTLGLGNGIYKSNDNGSTWYPLASTQSLNKGKLSDIFQGVWNIKVDISDTTNDVLYAACYGSIMKSTDGGTTWSNILGDIENKSFSTDIIVTPKGILYASLSSFTSSGNRPEKTGIWKSTDGGKDWTYITPMDFPNDTRIIRLALAPSNDDVFYAVTEVPQYSKSIQAFFPSYHSFWKYTNNPETGCGTWTKRTANLPGKGTDNFNYNSLNTLGGYALVMKVKPDDENVILLGGTSLFRTTNGFIDSASYINIGGYPYYWTVEELHPDMHGIAFLPSNPNTVFIANDGGIQVSSDYLANPVTWNYLNNGLNTTQFYSISIDHKAIDDGLMFGGVQDNASLLINSRDPYQRWNWIYGADGMSSAIADNSEFIIGSVYYGIVFTVDSSGKNLVMQKPNFLNWDAFAFYNYFTLDVDNSKTFYLAAKNKIWRKDDINISINDTSKVDSGWKEITYNKVSYSSFVTALEANSRRLIFGTSNGKVFRLDEPRTNQNKPIDITGSNFPYNGFVSSIEIDPDNPDFLFVTFSNYNVLSIFYSADGGISWTPIGGNLEGNQELGTLGPSIRFIKIVKYNGYKIYLAGTSIGLFSTFDLAGSNTIWVQEGANTIGNILVEFIDSRSTDGLVAVATQGAGVYTAYLSTLGVSNNSKYFSLGQNFPNPASDFTDIELVIDKDCFTEMKLYDSNGDLIKNLVNRYMQSGSHTIKIGVSDLKPGSYFYTIKSGKNTQTKKLIVLR